MQDAAAERTASPETLRQALRHARVTARTLAGQRALLLSAFASSGTSSPRAHFIDTLVRAQASALRELCAHCDANVASAAQAAVQRSIGAQTDGSCSSAAKAALSHVRLPWVSVAVAGLLGFALGAALEAVCAEGARGGALNLDVG